MFKVILEKIQRQNTRRVAVVETLDKRDVVNHMKGAIYMYKLQGKPYFNRTMVRNYLNEQIGWPRFNDPQSCRRFDFLFREAVSEYLPAKQIKGGYSFILKPSTTDTFTDKVLKG